MDIIPGSYDPILVTLSFTIAAIASYTALDLAGRVTPASSPRSRLAWILGGAIAMGTGIWSMHFIAMLAFQLPIPVNYDVPLTFLSWLDGIVASGLALLLFSRPELNLSVLLGGSTAMGLAIASMHYLGMAGLRVPVAIHYRPHLVALSVAVAIGASSTALWLAFQFRNASKPNPATFLPTREGETFPSTVLGKVGWGSRSIPLLKLSSAFVMGIAISGMHYTGMWATCFLQMPDWEEIPIERSDNSWLAIQIGVGTLIVLVGTLVTSLFDRRYTAQLVRQVALQESEKRFRSLIETMPVGVLLLDGDGQIILINEVGRELLGICPCEIPVKSAFDLNWQLLDEKGNVVCQQSHPLKQAIVQRQPVHNLVIGAFRPAKQDTLWLLLNVDPQLSDDGNIERVVCTFSNISDRKLAEEALQQSKHFIERITQASPNVLYIYDLIERRTVYSNRQIATLLGYTPAQVPEMGGAFFRSIIHPEDLPKMAAHFQQYETATDGDIFQLEYRVRDTKGEWRYILTRESVFARNPDGKVKQAIGSATDITDRKQAEIALEQQLKRERLVSAIQERIRSSLNLEEVLTTAVEEVRQFLSTDRTIIYQFYPDWGGSVVVESVGEGWTPMKGIDIEDNCFRENYAILYQQGRIRAIENIYAGDLSECHVNLLSQFAVKANLVVPISYNEKLWGLLVVHHCSSPRQWLASEIESLKQISVQLAIAIQQSTLFEQAKTEIAERRKAEVAVRESAEREKAIAQVIQRMRQTLDMETIFTATTQELRQVIKCDRVLVYCFQPDWSGELVAESVGPGWMSVMQSQASNPSLTAVSTEHDRCVVKSFESGNSVIFQDTYLQETKGGLYSKGRNYLAVEDIYNAGFNDCYINLLEQFQAKAYIIVPIFSGKKLWGLLAIYQNSGHRHWQEAEIKIAIQIGNQLGVALQQAELLERTKKQSEALQKAALAADTANRAKSEFLASMSHELRTPLNAILGFSQMIAGDASLKTEQQEYLGIINRAGEHLLSLINDILEMSKIEAGRTTLNESSFDLIGLLDSVEDMFRLKAKSNGLQLIFERVTDLPQFIKTDEGKLRQVLINILGNAIKFTEKGRVTVRVRVDGSSPSTTNDERSRMKDARLYFEIEDTGSGICPTEMNKLFEAFGQTETGIKSGQGTGLGLPISRKFVQLMGGDIRVSSKLGLGSIFTFDIKISFADRTEIKTDRSNYKVIGLAPNQVEYRILVVDDRPESRLLLARLFTSIGFQVQEAENGLEAISLWESWEPHLILMDMRMPIVNGYQATKHIKSSLRGQETAIVALSASAFEEDQKMAFDSGCDDFLSKPFQQEELLGKIRKHLGVQYICAESSADASKLAADRDDSVTTFQLTSESFKKIPTELVAQIQQAAVQCSDDIILNLVKQIPPENASIAQALTDLASNYEFEIIQELTKLGVK
ncbi:MHYT domain-containing protein [Aerosakkonema sp. BLCC-F183]|uniref:MHYT domain-containing protein n=1 Tax=Aerosakkonema sp. BLCC-F183 TaxID=3342834 RepID=UPI0035B9B479